MNTGAITKYVSIEQQEWFLVDATNLKLGRLCSKLAMMLQGKHTPQYTPNFNNGARIVVINARKVTMSKNKLNTTRYYYHTGYIGGIKSSTYQERLDSKTPEHVIEATVKNMLPKTRLGKVMFGNMHVYADADHKHTNHKLTHLTLQDR